MRVVAALGASAHAPLLLEHEGGLVVAAVRRGVAVGEAAAGAPTLLPCVGSVAVDGQTLDLYPYHPGSSLGDLAEQYPDGLPEPLARAVAEAVGTLIEELAPHGRVPALGDDDVRVGVGGEIRVVCARDGAPEEARKELAALLERLAEDSVATAIAEAALRPGGDRGRGFNAPEVRREYPSDRQIDAQSGTSPPPRLVVARIAVLVLVLGVAAGFVMAPRGAVTPSVSVEGARSMALDCGPRICQVEADFGDRTVRGSVDASSPKRYVCQRDAGTLKCIASSP